MAKFFSEKFFLGIFKKNNIVADRQNIYRLNILSLPVTNILSIGADRVMTSDRNDCVISIEYCQPDSATSGPKAGL